HGSTPLGGKRKDVESAALLLYSQIKNGRKNPTGFCGFLQVALLPTQAELPQPLGDLLKLTNGYAAVAVEVGQEAAVEVERGWTVSPGVNSQNNHRITRS